MSRKYRRKLSRRGSKRLFTATASRTRKENTPRFVMRGGIRM